jgi:Holliday junction resolvase RusA-like endonuclease
MKYTLPMPPTANLMYRRNPRGYGLYKTAEAKMWVQQCLKIIRRKNPLKGNIDLDIQLYFKRDADIDNRLKQLFDVLQDANVIVNDIQVQSLVVTKFQDKQNPRVEIEIRENS